MFERLLKGGARVPLKGEVAVLSRDAVLSKGAGKIRWMARFVVGS
jgi:hypothetical protein